MCDDIAYTANDKLRQIYFNKCYYPKMTLKEIVRYLQIIILTEACNL